MYNEHGYSIVENALEPEDYNNIKNYLNNVEWQFITDTAGEHSSEKDNNETIYKSSLAKILFAEDHYASNELVHICQPFMNCLNKFFDGIKLIRSRAGLFYPQEKEIIHGAHVDYPYPHHTALFYFSTETGAGHTYIYDEAFDPYSYKNLPHQHDLKKDTMQVIDKIEAKENRVLFFKGNVFHSSSSPKTIFKRIAVNINFMGFPRKGEKNA